MSAASGDAPGGPPAETPAVEVVSDLRCQLGESPLWSPGEQALWWVDIEGRALHRLEPASRRIDTWHAPERIGCIALHADGGFIAALEDGVWHLRPQAGGRLDAQVLARVQHPREGMRFNDGRCDREGRFWAVTMYRDTAAGLPVGSLYRYDARGMSAPLVSGLVVGNGTAFSPDGRTMYLSDAHASVRRIWAFELGADGSLSNRREFVDMNRHPGRPDGAAVDAEGCYWICATDAGRILRFTPEGELDRALALPVGKPTMGAFAGADLGDLYVTSLQPGKPLPGFDPALAGALLRLRAGVRGIAEQPFRP
jgi:sugar lactone lactonase YvrE